MQFWPHRPLSQTKLLTDPQFSNDSTITLDVLLCQVVQHLAALTDHLQQATAAVVVVDVNLQVLGELLDASMTAVFSSLRIMGYVPPFKSLPLTE